MCDNTRPYCKKCHDTGRECAGYERETVFIIGTPQDGGRCSSHPPRVIKSRKATTGPESSTPTSSSGRSNSSSNFVGSSSASTASSGGKNRTSPKSRANSRSASVSRTASASPGTTLSPSPSVSVPIHEQQQQQQRHLPPSSGAALPSGIMSSAKFDTAAVPMVPPMMAQRGNSNALRGYGAPDLVPVPPLRSAWHESVSVACGGIVHEHNSPLLTGLLPRWKDSTMQNSSIRQMGPARFATFPAHHFFARVYRPNAIWSALIFRRGTFLSEPEWTSMPWEAHPKSGLDRLLDIAALLPVMLGRADTVASHEPTMARRMMAQDVLANCIYVEQVLEQWHASLLDMGLHGGANVSGASAMGSAPATVDGGVGGFRSGGPRARASSHGGSGNWYWIADPEHTSVAAQIPFADTYAFRDTATALMFIYYWSIVVLLYPCVEGLHASIFHPVIDTYPSPFPNLPSSLQIPGSDPSVYYGPKIVRELSGNICRALDYALATTMQPDLLAPSLFVVESFYRKINAASGDGALELLWCEAFRSRLAAKGQYLAEVVQSRRWVDAGQF
ncbi:hypothetical protein SCUCBS95973_004325 [Sporothrix curviconia]|uniref:C6 zinc finger domain containing protein n=1 Tax=Sporothrix curviconia TaxID=1260050 RepID=A0ABP0BP12_9PEZI